MLNMLTVLAQAGAPVNDGGGGGAGLLVGGGLMLVFLIVGLLGLIFWIWALVDAIRNPALNDTERIIWVVVILLTSWLGALIYLIVGRKKGVAGPAKGF